MKINVEYYYQQNFLPTPRHKRPRTRQLKDTLSVNITDLTEKGFPVAFIVRTMRSIQINMSSYEDYDGEKCEYKSVSDAIRTYRGKLYSPLRVTYGAAISTLYENETYIKRMLEREAVEQWLADTEEPTENAVILSDNKKEVCSRLRKSAKKYIYYNGVFWVECGEPRYVINTFGLGHNHGSTALFIEYGYNPNISNKNYFNALQYEEAIEYGKNIATRRGDTESVSSIGAYDKIIVVMPEMVKVNPAKQHGSGNAFINMMEGVIDRSQSKNEAALLCTALAMTAAGAE